MEPRAAGQLRKHQKVCVGRCVLSVLSAASRPLSGALRPQVVGELLGLTHGVRQVHAVDAAQLALGA